MSGSAGLAPKQVLITVRTGNAAVAAVDVTPGAGDGDGLVGTVFMFERAIAQVRRMMLASYSDTEIEHAEQALGRSLR